MHWWGKSSKEEKKKARKEGLVDTVHGKFKTLSEKNGGWSWTSKPHYNDIGSPLGQVLDSQSYSGSSYAQVLPREEHPIATHVADSKRSSERRYHPSLLCSFARPDYIVETPDVSRYGTSRGAATNFSSSLKQKDISAMASKRNSREKLRQSKSCLNNQSVPISPKCQPRGSHSSSAPPSSMSSPMETPRRGFRHDPLSNSGVGSGKLHASPCAEYSPTPSPRMARTGCSSRVNSAAVTPLHQRVAGASTEPRIHRFDDGKQQSYKLPLPPEIASSPVPKSPSYSRSTNSQGLQRAVQTDRSSPGPRFVKGHPLGGGTFGVVYLGFDKNTGEMCAMKEVALISDDPKSKESVQHLNQEIELLSQFHHPNIVEYYGSETVGDYIYIYLEYVSGGSIHKVMKEYGALGESAIRSFTKQLLAGLTYLHARNTVHRDVKGANILLQPNGCVKLADFGLAKHISGEASRMSFKGSPYWIAPEVVRNSNANVSVDIWSLGCTVLEMATGRPPWGQYEDVAALFKIGNSEELPVIPDSLSEEGKDFIRICLQRDPSQRPSAEQLLKHPFVNSLPPVETHVPSPRLVDAIHLASGPGNPQSRNLQFPDPVSPNQTQGLRIVTSISNAHSPKDTPCPVSPTANLLPQSQSPQYNSATRSTHPISSPRGASGSSPVDLDIGAIQLPHPRTPQNLSERCSPTSIATPRGTHSSSIPISAGNVMSCHPPQSQKYRCGRLSPSLTSSPSAASGRNVLGHPTESELAHRVSQPRLVDHVKFNHQ